MTVPYYDASMLRAMLPFTRAIDVIEEALRGAVDPELDSSRLFSPAGRGEFLMIPGFGGKYAGVKVVTVAPSNPARGLRKIQGVYLLFDGDTLEPLAVMDGSTLTAIRTPATTLAAVKNIAASSGMEDLEAVEPQILVIGTGVQGTNHIRASQAVFPHARFSVVGRRPGSADRVIAELAEESIAVEHGSLHSDVADADIILCASSSRSPLFDGSLPSEHAIVASIGQHGLENREVDSKLVLRSDIVVEGRESSWRESGNLLQARTEQEWRQDPPPNIEDLVQGRFARTCGQPALFTGVGMAWEDLVIAVAAYETN